MKYKDSLNLCIIDKLILKNKNFSTAKKKKKKSITMAINENV